MTHQAVHLHQHDAAGTHEPQKTVIPGEVISARRAAIAPRNVIPGVVVSNRQPAIEES